MSDEQASATALAPDLSGPSAAEGTVKVNPFLKAAACEPEEKESKEQEPIEKTYAIPVDPKAEDHVNDENQKELVKVQPADQHEEDHSPEASAVTPEPAKPVPNTVEVSDLEEHHPNESPPSDYRSRSNSRDEYDEAEDEGHQDVDSSDDESSYFAKNLPSPKSSKRYSFSSNASAPARTEHHPNDNRETDASLSFSDESDEDAHPHSDSGTFPTPTRGAVADLHTHSHRITRMHSVSSLVSTSSQNSSASEGNVGDELRIAATNPQSGGKRSNTSSALPSGRRSPIMGEHPPSRPQMMYSTHSSMNPDPSPPTILPGYPNPYQAGLPHPEPHLMAQDPWAAWAAAGGAMAMHQQIQQPMYPYGYPAAEHDHRMSVQSSGSAWSSDTLAYSEDGEAHQAADPYPQSPGNRYPPSTAGRAHAPPAATHQTRNVVKEEEPSGTDGSASAMFDEARSESGLIGRGDHPPAYEEKTFEVYWQRWIMLMYMSFLNLLVSLVCAHFGVLVYCFITSYRSIVFKLHFQSDWTCYSVAPIAMLTEEAFGNINPELLVVVFLCANVFGTACEPIILSRLGLRRTVLFGSLLLMIGSIVKSGGLPPIIQADLEKGQGALRLYIGFGLVGLSQPLYQCTPALLSASWFPERERTLATGVALNSNQLGIGFAFIFGTLLVKTSDDIPSYFSLLSILATITFFGTLIQFDDAPPTPPSDTARVMRGTFETPNLRRLLGSFRADKEIELDRDSSLPRGERTDSNSQLSAAGSGKKEGKSSRRSGSGSSRRESSGRRSSRSSTKKSGSPSPNANKAESTVGGHTRRRAARSQNTNTASGSKGGFHGLAPPPSPARWGRVSQAAPGTFADLHSFPAPSPMMPGGAGPGPDGAPLPEGEERHPQQAATPGYHQPAPYEGQGYMLQQQGGQHVQPEMHYPMGPMHGQGGQPMPPGMPYPPGAGVPPYGFPYHGHPQYPYPYWDPQSQQSQHLAYYQQEAGYYQPPIDPYYYSYQQAQPQMYPRGYQPHRAVSASTDVIDDGAEPVLTMTPHHLEINIRDDQIWLSTRACLARPGFIHALVSFTVSGIIINTLSTFMDYLVRLNGAGREYTGIVGGSFQFAIMVSSLIIGQVTDRTRAYYSVTIGMLVLGAFGLAECGVNLDEDRGNDLRWSLVIVAILVGPLQPVSTELGVDVVYPLSENTVLVIQQLFSNLLSAIFIPCFKAMKDVGRKGADETNEEERPAFTFSFYVMIGLHAAATVFFATFNGRYLRFEHELKKKAEEEERKAEAAAAFQPVRGGRGGYRNEQQPLLNPIG
jgi:MFS family permease